jgi:hypothetical protein
LYIAVGPTIANVHVYLEHLVSPSDDLTDHVPEKRDRYLFGSHAGGSRFLFLRSNVRWTSGVVPSSVKTSFGYLPVTRVSLPSAHSRVAMEYLPILSPFTYRRHSRYCLRATYTACADILCPSDELPFTTQLLHHRLAVGSAELDCGSPCCALDCLRSGFRCSLMLGPWCRNVLRSCHEVASLHAGLKGGV